MIMEIKKSELIIIKIVLFTQHVRILKTPKVTLNKLKTFSYKAIESIYPF